MSLDNLLTIPEAAEKHHINVKRLRGAVWTEHQTGRLDLPIGDLATDQVLDDWRLEKLASSLGERP